MKEKDELTLREQELLFEMDSESKEDSFEPEDANAYMPEPEDDEDAHLWDDEEDIPDVPRKPKASWPEVKAQLNHWGQIFSSGDDGERAIASEHIFHLFDQVTESAKDFDDEKKLDRWYSHAVGILRIHFIGETDHPIRYLKHYYPEDLFYDALLHTLGFSASEGASGVYDATKGAQYVTHFTNVLENLCKQRRKKLNDDFYGENRVFSQNTIAAEETEEKSAPEAQTIQAEEARQQVAALVDLAMLTADKLQLDKVLLPIGDDAKDKPKNVKTSTLQLFYSFQLVNFTRFATAPVSHREDRILMSTADEGFLTYSTAIRELAYRALVQAELSAYVLENGLYVEKDGKKLLQQKVAAYYSGSDESTLSPKFDAARRYLSRHWHYKPM